MEIGMKKIIYAQALKQGGVKYLGATKQSMKLRHSFANGVETYGIYLAPSTLARDADHPFINVCPFSKMCKEHCLNGSGHNKIERLAMHGLNSLSKIDQARIKRTHLFHDDRGLFMEILICELERYKKHAEKNNMQFAVRLNCTSDISLEQFTYCGKNILELYPNVQFYDYTKVPSHLALAKKYPNYDLTFSYSGDNENICQKYLQEGGRVAVVFDLYDENGKQTLPKEMWGYKVIDGNKSDARFLDEKGVIVGLHYHRVASDYVNGKYQPKETPFVIR